MDALRRSTWGHGRVARPARAPGPCKRPTTCRRRGPRLPWCARRIGWAAPGSNGWFARRLARLRRVDCWPCWATGPAGSSRCARRLTSVVGPIVERAAGEHRRLYLFERQVDEPPPQRFAWTTEARVAGREFTLCQHPTLFSPARVDPATALLADNLPDRDGRWLDLGCGSGVLTVAAARPDRTLTAVDWSYAAVETTRRALAANDLTADVRLADAAPPADPPFDVVLCYPPFHVGPRVDHDPAAQPHSVSPRLPSAGRRVARGPHQRPEPARSPAAKLPRGNTNRQRPWLPGL